MNVAKPMIRYASAGNTRIPPIEQLDPLSRAKFILQQSIWSAFINVIADQDVYHNHPGPMCKEFCAYIEHLAIAYRNPSEVLSSGDRELYQLMVEQALNILSSPEAIATRVSLGSLEGALHFDTGRDCIRVESILGGPESYLPVLHAIGVMIPNDRLVDGVIPNATILLPVIHRGPSLDPYLIIRFHKQVVTDYSPYLFEQPDNSIRQFRRSPRLFQYLFSFNLQACDLDKLVALLSNFALEVDLSRYYTNDSDETHMSLSEICWYVITKLDIRIPGVLRRDTILRVLDILAFLLINHRIGVSSDTSTIGRVLSCCNLPDGVDIAQYLTKPATEITATEALCFQRSRLSKIFPDRILALLTKGNEAMEDPTLPEDDPTLDQDPGFSEDAPVEDEPDLLDKPGEPIQPGEDPARMAKLGSMVIELAKADESLADFLYKQAILSRIRDVIANPPVKLPTDELLFLKRWASSYINLVNIRTIKAFLACLSFKLMDLHLATDTPIGD